LAPGPRRLKTWFRSRSVTPQSLPIEKPSGCPKVAGDLQLGVAAERHAVNIRDHPAVWLPRGAGPPRMNSGASSALSVSPSRNGQLSPAAAARPSTAQRRLRSGIPLGERPKYILALWRTYNACPTPSARILARQRRPSTFCLVKPNPSETAPARRESERIRRVSRQNYRECDKPTCKLSPLRLRSCRVGRRHRLVRGD
jgi:hypothetical protein